MTNQTASLDALLIRNVGDIEAAMTRIGEELDPRLWREIEARLEATAASCGWATHPTAAKDGYWHAPSAWMTVDDGDPDSPFYFMLSHQAGAAGVEDYSDLAALVGASPHGNRIALSFEQDPLSPAKWKKLLRGDADALARLRDGGFVTDLEHGAIAFDITLDPDLLATAFSQNDFDQVLEPLDRALEAAAKLQPVFERLIAIVPKE